MDRNNINHPDHMPNPQLRPHGFHEHRPDPVVYIETAQMGPSAHAQAAGSTTGDGPVVLKRNQACLSCRKRKLKCDAVRPHCATCLRSYRHLLKTAPQSKPILACEYDDGDDTQSQHNGEDTTMASVTEDDDADGGSKKKRKSSDGRASKRKAESAEAEKLRKKIEQLEAQIAAGNSASPRISPAQSRSASMGNGANDANVHPDRAWANAAAAAAANNPSAFGTTNPASPTAFLEMLSSAASVHPSNSNVPAGLREGASESAMFNGATGVTYESSGFTPMFTFEEPAGEPERPEANRQTSGQSNDTRPSTGTGSGFTPYSLPTPGGPALSPTALFNFSPGPSGPFSGVGAGQSLPDAPKMSALYDDGKPADKGAFQWPGANATLPNQPTTGDQGLNDIAGLLPVDEELQQQLLMDLFWPGWPVNMPEPHIVNDLVEAFFESVPGLPRLLHKGRFLARMALPPTHSNFPHPSLIHSICSIASNWCEDSVYAKSKTLRVPDAKGRPLNFALRQASLAKEAVHDGLNTGNRMFDVVRAMMILSRIFIDDTRMLECWAYNGLVARMVLPLGLNVRSAELSLKSVMLPPPADALEREERRAAMWFALYHDTIASAASGWGTSISLDELTIALPCSTSDFDSGAENIESNPQDLDSPDFFTRHPVIDPFVLTLKASVIMNRVNRFARKWKNRHVREDDDMEGMNRAEFRELANAIACFQMSFPPSLRNVCRRDAKKRLDIDLITAHMLPHAATICLYEPFADLNDPADGNARRILSSAQSIVNIIQQLAAAAGEGSASFTSIMHSSASVCLITAARTSLIFYRHALNNGDHQSANGHRMDVEMIRMALSQFGMRFKIGHHHAQLVEYFLDRASHPTYEKLQAHYPEHPRPGAPTLTPNSDLGLCVMTALNIKRGYWRMPKPSTGVSPFTSTPDSLNAPLGSSSGSASSGNSALRFESGSPHNAPSSATSASAGRASFNAEEDSRFNHVLQSAMHRWADGSLDLNSATQGRGDLGAKAPGGPAATWGKLNPQDEMVIDNHNAPDKQGQRSVFGVMTDGGYVAKTRMDDAGQRRALASGAGGAGAGLKMSAFEVPTYLPPPPPADGSLLPEGFVQGPRS